MKAERRPEAPHDHLLVTLADDPPTLTDPRVSRRARERIQAQDRRRRICREAERLMPLARYYAGPPLLAVPIGEYYVRGRWAA